MVSLAFLVAVGLYSKVYEGPLAGWVNDSLAGTIYVTFWCLATRLVFRSVKPVRIIVYVLAATSSLEFMQLWHPPFLEYVRSFALGRTLIGTSFSWLDFPHYALGAAIGGFWIRKT